MKRLWILDLNIMMMFLVYNFEIKKSEIDIYFLVYKMLSGSSLEEALG